MNLIRNGGFESGDLEFWVSVGDGSAVVSDTAPVHGTYHAIITVGVGDGHTLHSQDYIPVLFGQIMVANWYAKSDGGGQVYARFYEYDGDLNLLATTDRRGGDTPGAYQQFQAMLTPQPNTEYMRIGVYTYADEAPANVSIDSCYASTLSGDDPLVYRIEIANRVGVVSSFNTSLNPYDMLGFQTYYADIDCTVLTGTNPTLDLTVVEKDVYGNEKVLGTFAQLSAAGHERISIDPPIGDGMYVKYVEGGTWTNATFAVTVTGVRS